MALFKLSSHLFIVLLLVGVNVCLSMSILCLVLPALKQIAFGITEVVLYCIVILFYLSFSSRLGKSPAAALLMAVGMYKPL